MSDKNRSPIAYWLARLMMRLRTLRPERKSQLRDWSDNLHASDKARLAVLWAGNGTIAHQQWAASTIEKAADEIVRLQEAMARR